MTFRDTPGSSWKGSGCLGKGAGLFHFSFSVPVLPPCPLCPHSAQNPLPQECLASSACPLHAYPSGFWSGADLA